ncbi:hypothetical protein N0V90_001810 [Kalmusia sp. IMI 367209]|nr:hypothetical protein N0V90_001810 [Kalmusia sp. IMI 367209]
MKLSALLFTAIPAITSAWHLQLYDNESYINVLEDRSGTLGQSCKTLAETKTNKVQSMHWEHSGLAGVICNVRLFDGNNCAGRVIADAQYGNWNLPAFSSTNKNTVNSYKIDCDE